MVDQGCWVGGGGVSNEPLSGSIMLKTIICMTAVMGPYAYLPFCYPYNYSNLTSLLPLRSSHNNFANHTLQSQVKHDSNLCETNLEVGVANESGCDF